jgi:ABC-2 type transport system ATP-binding protein
MKVLEVKDLTKIYGKKGNQGNWGNKGEKKSQFTAVDNISFSLEKGEIVGFLGPNGAGKTTTIQMLLGTLTPTKGAISYFGQSFWADGFDNGGGLEGIGGIGSGKGNGRKEVLRRVNFASAYSDLPWRLTVWENLSWYAEIYEVPNKRERILGVLKELGAEKFLNKTINNLSAGQKTRVMLAKAFLNKPEIVLLDEPTASLDVEVAVEVRNYIRRMQKEFGTTVLLTSHNMKDVEELAGRVLVINHGKIVDEGTPLELMQKMNRTKLKFVVFENEEKIEEVVREIGEIREIREGERVEVEIKDELIPKFLAKMFEAKVFIRDLEIERPGLEEYFLGEMKNANLKMESDNVKCKT